MTAPSRTADEIIADWHAGRADHDPYDEIGGLVAEVGRLRIELADAERVREDYEDAPVPSGGLALVGHCWHSESVASPHVLDCDFRRRRCDVSCSHRTRTDTQRDDRLALVRERPAAVGRRVDHEPHHRATRAVDDHRLAGVPLVPMAWVHHRRNVASGMTATDSIGLAAALRELIAKSRREQGAVDTDFDVSGWALLEILNTAPATVNQHQMVSSFGHDWCVKCKRDWPCPDTAPKETE